MELWKFFLKHHVSNYRHGYTSNFKAISIFSCKIFEIHTVSSSALAVTGGGRGNFWFSEYGRHLTDKKPTLPWLQDHNHPRDGRHIPGQEVAAEQPVQEDHHREQTGFELAVEHHGRRTAGDRTDFRTRPDVTGERSKFSGRLERLSVTASRLGAHRRVGKSKVESISNLLVYVTFGPLLFVVFPSTKPKLTSLSFETVRIEGIRISFSRSRLRGTNNPFAFDEIESTRIRLIFLPTRPIDSIVSVDP